MKIKISGLLLMLLAMFQMSNAQVDNKLSWESMKYGLFVHYVFGGEYGGMTPLSKSGGFPANIDELADKFDVQKFANDVKTMGFEYVIFTAWHANMGVLYPSKVMADYGFDQKDHYTSKRDLLGEIIDSLAVRGIKFCFYSHIFDGHDFHPQGSGYFSSSDKKGTITQDMINSGYVDAVNGNSTKWNDFINKVYDEMSSRYGEKVCGYWFDATWVPSNWVDKQRIMNTIWKTNPTAAMIANGTATDGMPYSSKEAGSVDGAEYSFQQDYPTVLQNDVTTWPSYERHVALVAGSNWWATQGASPRYNAKAVYRYTVLQAATNNSGGVGWSFGPYIDGSWEGTLSNTTFDMFKRTNSYLSPVAEAVKNTRASTSYITKEGSKIKNLQSGFVATRSINGLYEYIHVLTPRATTTLQLPYSSDGRVFDSATLLAKNKEVKIEKNASGYLLTLPEGEKWDELNTVFRLHLSEFPIKSSSSNTSFINPWGESIISIKTETGSEVTYTQKNDSCTFTSQSGKLYIIALVNSPVYKFGKIENNPASVEILFSRQLMKVENITGFSIHVNKQNIEVKSVSYNSNNDGFIFNLKQNITKDDTVTVSYLNGNIQSADSIILQPFSNMYIENLLPGSSPVLTSAKSNWEGLQIELSFNKKMNLAENALFSILNKVDKQNVGISSISLKTSDSTNYVLTLSNQVFQTDILEISYNGTNVQSYDNGTFKTIANVPVTNLSHGKSPQLETVIILRDKKSIFLTFDKDLNSISTQKAHFVVNINGITKAINSATSTNNTAVLTFATELKYGDIISLGFENGLIKSLDGGELTSIVAFSIINTIPDLVATQSTTNYGGYADLAIDGNTNGSFGAGSVTHTNETLNPWWSCNWSVVDSISDVTIWNRTDYCCSDRLANFYVFLSNTPFTSNDLAVTAATNGVWKYYHTGIVGEKIIVPVNTCGKYLRIQMAGTGTLSLAEVQISRNTGKCVTTSVQNLEESDQINVYPNPINGQDFTVDLAGISCGEKAQIEFFDMLGRMTSIHIKQNNSSYNISVKNPMVRGIYLLVIKIDEKILTKKLIF